jgi:catechol 2,3-dioxygenase-like lactoylglutathione lyase family enzyme
MLDHIIVTVRDFTRSIAFYEQALKPLGMTDFLAYEGQDGHSDLKGFGKDMSCGHFNPVHHHHWSSRTHSNEGAETRHTKRSRILRIGI